MTIISGVDTTAQPSAQFFGGALSSLIGTGADRLVVIQLVPPTGVATSGNRQTVDSKGHTSAKTPYNVTNNAATEDTPFFVYSWKTGEPYAEWVDIIWDVDGATEQTVRIYFDIPASA